MSVLSLSRPVATPVAVRRHARAGRDEAARMTRYRGGTYSHTVDTVVFTDGTSARTDLIRLNPNIAAYSLDFAGHAPIRPSRYRAADWTAVPHLRTRAHETEVAWILRNSYPTLTTAQISARLRAAGHPLGTANIAEHEAIAATQAAIWTFTNDLHLDTRPRSLPVTEQRTADGIVFDFGEELELGGYIIELVSRSAVSLLLQKSADGVTWHEVGASGLNVEAGRGRYRKSLGVGSTVRVRHGRRGHGYRYYRLVILGDAAVVVGQVRFWLTGAGEYRNADRIVHLYNYLLDGARRARGRASRVDLIADDAVAADGLIGPFRLTEAAEVSVASGDLVDADGVTVPGPVLPGDEFYLRPRPGAGGVLLTATMPATAEDVAGRVVTGVACEDGESRLTPVALAQPAPLVVDFAIYPG